MFPGGQEESRQHGWVQRTPLLLVLTPFVACVILIVWLVSKCLSFYLLHSPATNYTHTNPR